MLFLYDGNRKQSAFYYKTAMESRSQTGLTVQPLPVQQAADLDLSRYAFVVLDDVQNLDAALERKVAAYVRRGGALFVLLGPGSALHGHIPVSGGEFSETRETQGAQLVSSEDPAMQGVGALDNIQFFQTARITPGPGARVLAKLADGSPLLLEQPLGEGRLMIFAATFDNVTTDFPLHASFVPFVAQTARYLAGSEQSAVSTAAGSPIELRRTRDQGAAADVIGPGGRHELSLQQAASVATFEPSETGFYEVHRANGRRMLVAVHSDRRESDLTPVPDETLALWSKTGTHDEPLLAGSEEPHSQPLRLWRYVMILLLAVALAESFLASRHMSEGAKTV